MRKHSKTILIIASLLFAAAVAFNAFCSSAYYSMENIIFQNTEGNQISASWLEGTNGKGVILVPDIEHDKTEFGPMVAELKDLGYSVFVFDMPGSGASEGSVPFHYNDTTYTAEQFYNALFVFSSTAQIPISDIHILAFGEGARAALYTAYCGFIEPRTMVLAGTAVNLDQRRDYDILNYTNDVQAAWLKDLSASGIFTDICLVASPADTVSSVESSEILKSRLDLITRTTETVEEKITYPGPVLDEYGQQVYNDNGEPEMYPPVTEYITHTEVETRPEVSLITTGKVLHPFLAQSREVIADMISYIAAKDGIFYTPSSYCGLRPLFVALIFLLLAVILKAADVLLEEKTKYDTASMRSVGHMPAGFLKKKLIVLAASLPLSTVLAAGVYFISKKVAYTAIIPAFMIASNGLLLAALYAFTDFGKGIHDDRPARNENYFKGAVAFAAMIGILTLISLSGFKNLCSWNVNWFVRAIMTVLFAVMFYIDSTEREHAAFTAAEKKKIRLINYSPAFILPILALLVGNINGAVITAGKIFPLITAVLFGEILERLDAPKSLSALCSGFILQMVAFAQLLIYVK